jgi:hypothetical protein
VNALRQTTEAFRSRYRAAIHPLYNPWLHGAFVLLFGVLAIGAFWSSARQVQPLEWLSVPLTLLFFNVGVYMVHRHLGHHKRRSPSCSMRGMPATTTAFSLPAT